MADSAPALTRRLIRYMQEKGLRHTRQRQAILETFLEVEDHVAIDELLARVQNRMPGIGYATVYRTMKLFTDAGVAHERRFQDGQSRYEPVTVGDEQDEHHDHIICTTCGHIFEFEDPEIEARQQRAAAERGLRIVSHEHEIYGECMNPATCEWRGEVDDSDR